jgi:hypothetical protein
MTNLALELLPGNMAVAQLPASANMPLNWDHGEALFAVIRTAEEVSIVCSEESVPDSVLRENGWRVIKVCGQLDFSLVGILSHIATILTQVGVSIYVVSTYNTDYILVKETKLSTALNALTQAGYVFEERR